MTRREEQDIKAFITEALAMHHLLNCVPHDPDLTPEDREELLAYQPFTDACMRLAYTLRRAIWREWDRQRQEERKRKRAAKQRRQAAQKRKRDAQKKAPKRTR